MDGTYPFNLLPAFRVQKCCFELLPVKPPNVTRVGRLISGKSPLNVFRRTITLAGAMQLNCDLLKTCVSSSAIAFL